jgi:WD40 repeat protein
VKIWDAESGQLLHTLHGYDDASLRYPNYRPWALSPDAQRFAWGEFGSRELPRSVKVLAVADEGRIGSWKGHQRGVECLRFSPDGRYLASAGDDRLVILWNAATGEEVLTLRGHARAVRSLAFSPDGRRLASGGADQTVRIWDVSPLE